MAATGSEDNFGELLGAMSQLQQQLQRAESEANARSVIGRAAAGQVTVTVSGDYSFDRITIDPSIIEQHDVTLIEDLILAALRDAVTQLKTIRMQSMSGAVSEALGGLFGGDKDQLQGGDHGTL